MLHLYFTYVNCLLLSLHKHGLCTYLSTVVNRTFERFDLPLYPKLILPLKTDDVGHHQLYSLASYTVEYDLATSNEIT